MYYCEIFKFVKPGPKILKIREMKDRILFRQNLTKNTYCFKTKVTLNKEDVLQKHLMQKMN